MYNVCIFGVQTLFMSPMQQYTKEVGDLTTKMIRETMPEPCRLLLEVVAMENNPMHMIFERKNMPATFERQFLLNNGWVKCKRKEATFLVYVSKLNADATEWVGTSHYYIKTLTNEA